MTDLSVVCWRWKPAPGYRSVYPPSTVNTLKRMVARNYQRPHRFICVTDDATGLDADVEVVPLWPDHADLASPHGARSPSCYRRLRAFAPDAGQFFGPRFVSIDLDCVITGDVTPVWDRPEDAVFWGGTHPTTAYNGSMVLLTAGARPQVWERFDPATSPAAARLAGCYGSDQGWISHCLGPAEAKWTRADGIYSLRNDLRRSQHLPVDARIVMFHGRRDPWQRDVQREFPWIGRFYR
ncbi:MAG: hypothetical protein Q8T13_23700 [Acidobacteriota bacterium]|nr:hypothetical protein [Acidobacteriota bacterium]